MGLNLNTIWIETRCPNCNYQSEIQMIDIKLQSTVICNNCKSIIRFIDETASIHKGMDKIDKSIKEIENIFKKFK